MVNAGRESPHSHGGADRARRLIKSLEGIERAAGGAGSSEPIRLVRAPGRVNLIGEHTDYNEGLALPAAIDMEVMLAFRPWDEQRVELTSIDLDLSGIIDLGDLSPDSRQGTWLDYVAGVAWAARGAGHHVRGFRGVLDSTLPIGAGLSSSAALEMASVFSLLPSAPSLPSTMLAGLGREAENQYVGVQTGILDQLASASGIARHALLIDCRSLDVEPVALPPNVVIVVCHPGSTRRLKGSEYVARRADCAAGVRVLAAREPEVSALRDVDERMLERHRDALPDRVWRRCLHVVRENERVTTTVAALRAGDLDAVGRAFAASHTSLRDLFEVVSPEQDVLVQIARDVDGVLATRMTGGGFGGCTVNLVRPGALAALTAAVLAQYPGDTGLTPRIYPTSSVDRAGLVELAGSVASPTVTVTTRSRR